MKWEQRSKDTSPTFYAGAFDRRGGNFGQKMAGGRWVVDDQDEFERQ